MPPVQQVPHVLLYKRYLQHLRLLPDPHIWAILQPRFKNLIKRSGQSNIGIDDVAISSSDGGESSSIASKRYRSEKALRKATKLLNRLRAAVACHPHSLDRLLEEVYGQRGSVRWDLIRSIDSSYLLPGQQPLSLSRPLPAPLLPLKPPPLPPPEKDAQPRARRITPACVLRARERRAREREWALVKVPLVLPPFTILSLASVSTPISTEDSETVREEEEEIRQHVLPRTGWEEKPIIKNLRILAALDTEAQLSSSSTSPQSSKKAISTNSQSSVHKLNNNALDISSLSSPIQRIFPSKSRKYKLPQEPYSPPPPRYTRQNPNTWGLPHLLTSRMLIRSYRRLWENLVWVRPSYASSGADEERWEKCTFDQMIRLNPHSVTDSDPVGKKEMKQSRKSRAKKEKEGNTATGADKYKWSGATDQELEWIQASLSPKSIEWKLESDDYGSTRQM